jgi:hypothetical protein
MSVGIHEVQRSLSGGGVDLRVNPVTKPTKPTGPAHAQGARRLERALRDVGREHRGNRHWQAGVWARIRRSERSAPWFERVAAWLLRVVK